MNLFNAIAEAQGGQGISNLASQFGLSTEQTQQAVGALIPQLVAGMQAQSGGLGALVGMLSGGAHASVADQPGHAFGEQGVALGNEVLGQVFGSKDVSRGVADTVAQQTGIGADVLRQMLPVVATLVMGALAKHGLGGGAAAPAGNGEGSGGLGGALAGVGGLGSGLGGLLGGMLHNTGGASAGAGSAGSAAAMLSSVLDANKDGSVADDLMKLAGGFFNRR